MSERSGYSTSYRPDIDGLRAIAVTSVVVYHAFPRTLPGGFIGVDIFFVISGYLISGILFKEFESATFSYSEFYDRRIARIFPALISMLFAFFVVGWAAMQPADFARLGKEANAGALFIANLALWRETGYFDIGSNAKPLLHLWSLGIEEQFYILWPVLLSSTRHKRGLLLRASVLVGALSFIVNVATIKLYPDAAFYSPASRIWELMFGSILAYVALHHGDKLTRGQNIRSVFGFVCISASLFVFDSSTSFPGWAALAPVFGSVLLISSPDAWPNRSALSFRLARWIGWISYPLYLWHWPVLYFVTNYGWLSKYGDTTSRAIAMAISVLLSVGTYALIEKPIRFGRLRHHAMVPLALCMCAAAIAGVIISANDGFPYRDQSQYAEIAKLAGKYPATEWRDHECFLGADEGAAKFSPACSAGPAKPNIYLWGDSYAAALYPGFKSLAQHAHFGLSQYTASACPPYIGLDVPDRPYCRAINAGSIERISNTKPDIIVIAANWSYQAVSSIYSIERLPSTVAKLREIGVKHIVIVGPTPQWKKPLPSLLEQCSASVHTIGGNQFSQCGLADGTAELDKQMKAMARSLGVSYVSLYDILCNEDGCLALIRESSVSSYDIGHLTPAAATYAVTRSSDVLLGRNLLNGKYEPPDH